jgi:uncharacterized protein (TIGR03066 family)
VKYQFHWEPRARTKRRSAPHEVAQNHSVAADSVVAPPRRLRLGLILLSCLVGSGVASYLVFVYVLSSIPHELVGTWVVTDGALRGATLEFRRDGTASATMYKQGKKAVTNSSVKVERPKMYLTTRDDQTGKEETVTQTIVELTEEELVIRDEDQNTYRMMRVRN